MSLDVVFPGSRRDIGMHAENMPTIRAIKAVTRIYFRGVGGRHSIACMAEARRAEEGVGFLGGRGEPHPHQLWV